MFAVLTGAGDGSYPLWMNGSDFFAFPTIGSMLEAPVPGQRASGTCRTPPLAEMSVVTGNFLDMENLQGFEGLSALEESAVRLHEIYKSLMTGGFTEDEALSLIAKMTKSGPNP